VEGKGVYPGVFSELLENRELILAEPKRTNKSDESLMKIKELAEVFCREKTEWEVAENAGG